MNRNSLLLEISVRAISESRPLFNRETEFPPTDSNEYFLKLTPTESCRIPYAYSAKRIHSVDLGLRCSSQPTNYRFLLPVWRLNNFAHNFIPVLIFKNGLNTVMFVIFPRSFHIHLFTHLFTHPITRHFFICNNNC